MFRIIPLISYMVLLLPVSVILNAQVDHYAAPIIEGELWQYSVPDDEPSSEWITMDFDDSAWGTGASGFGYGDSDDNTILPNGTLSVYLRKTFNITEVSEIEEAFLYLDYDDGFVAYINGVEFARANVTGNPPTYDQSASTGIEPALIFGGIPTKYEIDTSLLNDDLNIIAIQIHNRFTTSSDMTAIPVLIFGINTTSDDYMETPEWFTGTGAFESNLPIVIIETENKVILDDPKSFASIGIIYHGEGELNSSDELPNAYTGYCGIETRGETSQMFLKKSYDLEMWDEHGSDIDTGFLNFPSEEDFVLYGPYSDKSLMNNVLGFRLANEMGNYASRTRYIELIIDSDYKGVYVLMEKIKRDKDRIDIAKLRPEEITGDDVSGGYIVRLDKGNHAGWFSQYDDFFGRGKLHFQYYYPDQRDIVPEQESYIKAFFDDFEAAMFAPDLFNGKDQHYTDYIDLISFVDNFIINEISKNQDAYRNSTYFYKDKDSKGGKLKAGYWDLNLAFGNIDFNMGDFCDGNSNSDWAFYTCAEAGYPVWWDIMLQDTLFNNAVNCRWSELRETILHKDSIFSYIDAYQLELQDAQERNFQRWPIMGVYVWPNPADYIKATHQEVIVSLKNWISNRIDWIDANIPGVAGNCDFYTDFDINPAIEPENIHSNPAVEFSIFPNPASSSVHVKSSELIHEISLLSLTGELLMLDNPGASQFQVDIATMASGVYVIVITTDLGQFRQRVLINH